LIRIQRPDRQSAFMEARQTIEHELAGIKRQRTRPESRIVLERKGACVQHDPTAVDAGPSQGEHAGSRLGDSTPADVAREIQGGTSIDLNRDGGVHVQARGADGRSGRARRHQEAVDTPSAPLAIDGGGPQFATGQGEVLDVGMAVDRQQSARVDAGGTDRPVGVIDAPGLVHHHLATVDDDVAGRTTRQGAVDRQGRPARIGIAGAIAVVGRIPRVTTRDGDDSRHARGAQRTGPEREIRIHAPVEMERRTGPANDREP